MSTGLFVGRFSPLHDGHKACIRKILEDHDECVVGIRVTKKSEKNPFSLADRIKMVHEEFGTRVKIMPIEDPECDLTVYIGRDVGYELIKLTSELESISATNIRKELYGQDSMADGE